MKNIIFIAPPAAGKGTLSKMITDEYSIAHISTGDLLREASSGNDETAKYIQEQMQSGGLVSDEIILDLLKKKISSEECNGGYILDGFPRNVEQAKAYDNILEELNKELGYVFLLDIDKEIAKARIVGRVSCPECGAVYNELSDEMKPQNDGICDKCGKELVRRSDDNAETFEKRFNTYYEKTQPLINYYQEKGALYTVSANDGTEKAYEQIKKIMFGE